MSVVKRASSQDLEVMAMLCGVENRHQRKAFDKALADGMLEGIQNTQPVQYQVQKVSAGYYALVAVNGEWQVRAFYRENGSIEVEA